MSYAVARVGSIVKVGDKTGKVITGASSHFVDGGGAGSGPGGAAPDVLITENIGIETEEMTPAERHAYIASKYGEGTADAMDRATQTTVEDPGSEAVSNPTAQSKQVGCDEFTNSTPDSAKVSKYFTVGNFSSGAALPHTVPNNTAKGMTRADVLCNIKHLATNSIDPLKDWLTKNGYTMQIGSAFRNETGKSDHNIGSAADIYVFKGGSRVSREELREVAKNVLNTANLPFTQFLLEFAGNGSLGWMHIANRKSGGNSAMRIGYSLDNSATFHPNLPRSV